MNENARLTIQPKHSWSSRISPFPNSPIPQFTSSPNINGISLVVHVCARFVSIFGFGFACERLNTFTTQHQHNTTPTQHNNFLRPQPSPQTNRRCQPRTHPGTAEDGRQSGTQRELVKIRPQEEKKRKGKTKKRKRKKKKMEPFFAQKERKKERK